MRLELRVEAFNIFNHPDIVARSGTLGGVNATTGAYIVPSTFAQGIGGINGVDPGLEFQFQVRVRY